MSIECEVYLLHSSQALVRFFTSLIITLTDMRGGRTSNNQKDHRKRVYIYMRGIKWKTNSIEGKGVDTSSVYTITPTSTCTSSFGLTRRSTKFHYFLLWCAPSHLGDACRHTESTYKAYISSCIDLKIDRKIVHIKYINIH